MLGKISNIQRFCIDDGPGIRTTVFFVGCPVNCLWCHNPETKNKNGAIFFFEKKCVSCGRCAEVCACHKMIDGKHIFDRENCVLCGKCAEIGCGALEYTVKKYSAEELIDEVKRDSVFYKNSGGGLTVSGGEPMMQFDFLFELLTLAKQNGINICLETSGYAKTEQFEKISGLVDTFLYDYKLTDEKKHIEYTGVSNELILNNLYRLNELCADVVLRCVIIPGINDDKEHLSAIGKLADSLDCIKEVCIEPYHDIGNSKRYNMGKSPALSGTPVPTKEDIEGYIAGVGTRKKCTY